MKNKDLYYKKYLKYKNKYLNLRNLIGGGGDGDDNIPPYNEEGQFKREIDLKNSIYLISYNQEYKSGFRNIKYILNELTNNNTIQTVKIDNLNALYNKFYISLSLFYSLMPPFPSHITRLIFDGNDLSKFGIIGSGCSCVIDLIINFINNFENVSSLSFQSCRLTEKTARYLLQELKKLGKTFTKIDLEDNDKLTPEIKMEFTKMTVKNL
jgi:hypothetical protein